MTNNNWRGLAELIGIAAIVASLIFVGLQIQLDRTIGTTQAYTDSTTTDIGVTQLLNENRDLWIRGLKGEELSEVDMSIFYDLSETAVQRKVGIYRRRVDLGAGNPDTWVESYAYEMYMYPGLRRAFELRLAQSLSRRSAFGRETRESPNEGFTPLVAKALADLDARSPPIPTTLTYTLR